MVLDHFHIFERDPSPVCQSHPIARLDPSIRSELIDSTTSPSGYHDSFSMERHQFALADVDCGNTVDSTVVHEDRGREPFVVPVNILKLQASQDERVENLDRN